MLVNQPPQQRLILVTSLSGNGPSDEGDSLAGLNVNELPDGAIVFVKSNARFYQLVKNLSVTVVAAGVNVIDAVGSSAVNGRFCAVQQAGLVTLVGGTVTAAGFYLPVSSNRYFLATLVTPGGTPGFVHVTNPTDHSITVTSSQGADTGTYLVVAVSANN